MLNVCEQSPFPQHMHHVHTTHNGLSAACITAHVHSHDLSNIDLDGLQWLYNTSRWRDTWTLPHLEHLVTPCHTLIPAEDRFLIQALPRLTSFSADTTKFSPTPALYMQTNNIPTQWHVYFFYQTWVQFCMMPAFDSGLTHSSSP